MNRESESCSMKTTQSPTLWLGLAMAAAALLPATAHAQAIEAWVQRTAGPGEGLQLPAMAVDASGNVVVTTPSYAGKPLPPYIDDWVTTMYSGAGVPLWTNRNTGNPNGARPEALAVDTDGNVLVAGWTSSPDAAYGTTVKYSSEGLTLWTRSVEWCSLDCLAVDSDGNVFVMGQAAWDGENHDLGALKYSSAGDLLWSQRDSVPASPMALATDADGNVVMTGHVRVADASRCSSVTVKYSNAGVPLWTNLYGGFGDMAHSIVRAMALDHSGNVIVTSDSQSPRGDLDFLTIKFSSAGVPLWTNYYNGPANDSDHPHAVAVDASDNVYVTGESWGGNPASGGTLNDYATIKYSSTGVPLWTNYYNGPANNMDVPSALAVDASGNVFVTGSSVYPNGTAFVTVAYSSSGVPLWTNLYHNPSDYRDFAYAIALDGHGGVYVTGSAGGSADGSQGFDVVTLKYVVPPIITCQPMSCTNAIGSTANFTVEVAGSAPFGFRWRKDGAELMDGGRFFGVTTPNLVNTDVQLADAAGYSVVVTNAYSTATSTVAQLTVIVPPSGGRLTDFSYSLTTGFSFIFRDGTVGQPYRIQRASSLAEGSWADWMTFTYTEPVAFTDLGALTTTNRFYRMISP